MSGGGILPVVHRELRAGARRPLYHWLRVFAAFVGAGILCVNLRDVPIANAGAQLIGQFHRLLTFLILCVVPGITADCIASERREGTLGLLFLTPLRSWEIVIGKVFAQALKAVTLWLALVPVLTIPVLAGGVTAREVVTDLGAELCVGIFCLAAGIVATSLTDKRATAVTLAFSFMAVLVFGLTEEHWTSLLRSIPGVRRSIFIARGRGWVQPMMNGVTTYYFRSVPPVRIVAPGPMALVSLWPMAGRVIFSLLVLWGSIRFAGFRVERSWQDRPPTRRWERFQNLCRRSILQRRFEKNMRRTLEWNPIAWLQQYSWRARLVKWGLCLAFTVLMCMASAAEDFWGIVEREWVVFAIMAAAYIYAGVNGFLQEKKSGALELILVTPLTINEVIFGRVWGLWKQFLPAAIVLAGCYYTIRGFEHSLNIGRNYLLWGRPSTFDQYSFDNWVEYFAEKNTLWEFAAILGFFTLPFYATLSALRVKNIVVAAARTLLTVLAAPLVGVALGFAAVLLRNLLDADPNIPEQEIGGLWFYGGILVCHAVLVALAFRNLRRRLALRNYSF